MVAQAQRRGNARRIVTIPTDSLTRHAMNAEAGIAARIELETTHFLNGVSLARPGMNVLISTAAGKEISAGISAMTNEFCVAEDGDGNIFAARWDNVTLATVRPHPAFTSDMPDATIDAFKR